VHEVEADIPWVQCPKCGALQPDLDGFGFLACIPGCGYCTHPCASVQDGDWICGICEKAIPEPEQRSLQREKVVADAKWNDEFQYGDAYDVSVLLARIDSEPSLSSNCNAYRLALINAFGRIHTLERQIQALTFPTS